MPCNNYLRVNNSIKLLQVVRFEFVGNVVAFNVSPLCGWSWQHHEFAVARLMRPHASVLSVPRYGGGLVGWYDSVQKVGNFKCHFKYFIIRRLAQQIHSCMAATCSSATLRFTFQVVFVGYECFGCGACDVYNTAA